MTKLTAASFQYLFRSKYVNFVSGAGYFDIDSEDEIYYLL